MATDHIASYHDAIDHRPGLIKVAAVGTFGRLASTWGFGHWD